jgi:magnesium chelatase subunit D
LKFFIRFRKKRTIGTRGRRARNAVFTQRLGRGIRAVGYKKGENLIAPFYTVVRALYRGHYDRAKRVFSIKDADFAGWQRLERESLTMVMVVDVSNSTYPYVRVFADILKNLTEYFRMTKQDRIGLISLQGAQAKIMNHPTCNYQIVTGNLLKLKVQGETPLADGLLKARAMVRLEQYRKPGSRNLVMLLSDCYPEPLTGMYEDLLDEPAYRDAVRAATFYRKERISLLVINPRSRTTLQERASPGERLAQRIVEEGGGKLITLQRSAGTIDDAYTTSSSAEIRMIIHGIEEMFGKTETMGSNLHMLHNR